MTFQSLHDQLLREISRRVDSGDTTVSSIARRAGISQPHLHLALKGKRGLSWDFADRAALVVGLRVEDLVDLAATARPGPNSGPNSAAGSGPERPLPYRATER